MNLKKAKEIIQNLFREIIKKDTWERYSREELKQKLKEAGYTDEEAEKILTEHVEEVIIPYFEEIEHIRSNNTTTTSYLITSEDKLVKYHYDKLEPKVERRWEMEPRDYVPQDMVDETDETEHKIREIYATRNVEQIRETEFLQEMKKRGYSESEIQELIKKYIKKHILDTGVDVEKIPAYRYEWGLAYNHLNIEPEGLEKVIKELYNEAKTDHLETTELIERLTKKKYTKDQAEQIIKKLEQEKCLSYSPIEMEQKVYVITHPDIWRYEEYQKYLQMKYCEGIYQEGIRETNATWNIKFKDIKELLQQAEKNGQKYVKHTELVKKLAEKCKTTEEEAEIAVETAELYFKIETKPNQTKGEEKEYWWRGIADGYPLDLDVLDD
ncbi:MAG: hypothetical protein ACUVXA_03360 [Candidatus Jordarchaeum sp.]|uniref:hypothetical protein n=1 Tax=Candidatus Jordarchaeum sp. TaxID=2823881 RepID=UPI004049C7B8